MPTSEQHILSEAIKYISYPRSPAEQYYIDHPWIKSMENTYIFNKPVDPEGRKITSWSHGTLIRHDHEMFLDLINKTDDPEKFLQLMDYFITPYVYYTNSLNCKEFADQTLGSLLNAKRRVGWAPKNERHQSIHSLWQHVYQQSHQWVLIKKEELRNQNAYEKKLRILFPKDWDGDHPF